MSYPIGVTANIVFFPFLGEGVRNDGQMLVMKIKKDDQQYQNNGESMPQKSPSFLKGLLYLTKVFTL
jgi:hypothetical protein